MSLHHQRRYKSSFVCLVEGTFVAGARIGRAGSVPGSIVICIGETQCTSALLLVLETPAEE